MQDFKTLHIDKLNIFVALSLRKTSCPTPALSLWSLLLSILVFYGSSAGYTPDVCSGFAG